MIFSRKYEIIKESILSLIYREEEIGMAQFFNFEKDYFGLTEPEVQKRIELYGLNTYTKEGKEASFSYWQVLMSPAVLLMFAAAILSFFNGNIGQGIAALLIDAAYVCAEIYARRSADQRLKEIKDTTVTKFRVIRGGKPELVEKENIVPEDTIVVQAGERVPADAFIMESRDLTADESIFTGDRTPVPKYIGAISKNELKPTFVYSGTTILNGIAVCQVSATGVDTRLHQVKGNEPERHSYYTSLERIVRGFVPIAGIVAVALTLSSMIIRIVSHNGAAESVLNGLTVGLCFVPAGLGAVIRLFYTKGAMELLKNGAVVKSFSDIEKLNSLSVLCIEKEGAISKNHLEVRGIYSRSEELLYKVAALACEPNHNDAAINALMVKATFYDENIKNVYSENTFIEKLPESTDTLSGAIWEVGGERLCCIKGVPDQILPMCRLSDDALYSATKKYEEYYAKGCSVLAVACVDAPDVTEDVTAGFSYTFVGFAAFSSPLRDSVSSAVKTCRRSGVRVVMLTEDNPSVAASTGKMIGISGKDVVTGKDIDDSISGLGAKIDFKADIYAKITPAQKMYIIQRLKDKGDVVAMTGTRSEDASVLEASDVGITISQHASGSAYEAADIIMNNDNFTSIANMIAKARRIHRNIKLAVSSIIAGYVGLILLVIINLFSPTVTVLMPTPPIVALITMVFLPLAGLGFINKSCDAKTVLPPSQFVANRKLNMRFIGGAVLFGALSGVVAWASYWLMNNNSNFGFARSCSLITYCFSTASFIVLRHMDNDSFKELLSASLIAKLSVLIITLLPIILVYIPFVNSAFGLGMIDILALFISIISGILPAIAYFFIKYFFKLKELS